MERPPEYVMILFPPCDLSLTPQMHGDEVYFHCLFVCSLFVFIVFGHVYLSLNCYTISIFVLSVLISWYHKMALCAQKCFIYLSRVICYTICLSTELYIVFELS